MAAFVDYVNGILGPEKWEQFLDTLVGVSDERKRVALVEHKAAVEAEIPLIRAALNDSRKRFHDTGFGNRRRHNCLWAAMDEARGRIKKIDAMLAESRRSLAEKSRHRSEAEASQWKAVFYSAAKELLPPETMASLIDETKRRCGEKPCPPK